VGFAAERGLRVAGFYVENVSGASLARPELFRLLADSRPGDVLLVEQVDRLSRLSDADWKRLRSELDARQIRVVALDLPTSWMMATQSDEFTARMFGAVNAMMLDVLAAVAKRIMRIGAGVSRRGKPRRKPRAATEVGQRIPRRTRASPACSMPHCHGHRYRTLCIAAAARSPRSPCACAKKRRPPESRHELIRCRSLLLRFAASLASIIAFPRCMGPSMKLSAIEA